MDLQQEIQLDREWGVVSLRRLHSAKILVDRERLNVTVAVYQGDGAKRKWQRDVKNYMTVRHPNIVQLYGTATYGNVHAAVFHDDLMPLQHFRDRYRDSHFSSVYIKVYTRIEFDSTIISGPPFNIFCRSMIAHFSYVAQLAGSAWTSYRAHGLEILVGEISEGAVIDSLTLEQYHAISYWVLSIYRSMSISPSQSVNLGSVYHCPSHNTFDDVVEIAWLPNTEFWSNISWHGSGNGLRFGELMAGGWTRLESNDMVDRMAWVEFSTSDNGLWLSQANHIFTALQISSNLQHYVILCRVYFELTLSASEGDSPQGFLFLCPLKHFHTGPSLKWPDSPAYWSLDKSGAGQLTPEDAANLGFPSVLSTNILGFSWDASVYAGLRQFHKAKGFDPDSQDVARHLGHELYQVSGPFAHIDEVYSDKADDGNETGQNPIDEQLENGTLMDNDEEYFNNTGDSDETKQFPIHGEFDAVAGSTLMDPRMDLVVDSTHLLVFQEIVDSTRMGPAETLNKALIYNTVIHCTSALIHVSVVSLRRFVLSKALDSCSVDGTVIWSACLAGGLVEVQGAIL
ncbi:hypothetical protein C8R45DRAFT_1220440 [Mycena sanguinolenta]|nr:hypothetical protein C8R45DRAFT_1220440 [Mycena sanguinolenta]